MFLRLELFETNFVSKEESETSYVGKELISVK